MFSSYSDLPSDSRVLSLDAVFTEEYKCDDNDKSTNDTGDQYTQCDERWYGVAGCCLITL